MRGERRRDIGGNSGNEIEVCSEGEVAEKKGRER